MSIIKQAFVNVNRRDRITAFTACLGIFLEQVNYLLHTLNRFSGLSIPYITQAVVIFFGLLVGYSFLININKKMRAFTVPFVALTLYCLSFFLYGRDFHYLSDQISEKFFLYCLPAFFAMAMVTDYKIVIQYFLKFSVLSIVTQTIAIINLSFFPQFLIGTDYQTISYSLLIPLCFFVLKKDRKKWELFAIILMVTEMVLAGGRGALLCTIICIAYQGLLNAKKNMSWLFWLGSLGLIIYLRFVDLIDVIVRITDTFGFGGSIKKYFFMGDLFWDGGRIDILDKSFKVIHRFWAFGTGLGGDRFWLGEYGYKYGSYTHNFFTEVLIHFGIIFGTLFIIWVLNKTFYWFRQGKTQPEATLLVKTLFFSGGFMGLMFSGSYLTTVSFFSLLGIIVYRKTQVHNRKAEISKYDARSNTLI